MYERFDKVHNKIQWRWNDDVDGDWSRQRAIMSFLRQFLGKSRKSATMEQSGGDGAPIFSLSENRREKRTRHINTTERKRVEGKKEKERKERKAKEQNIFVRFSRKINYCGCVCPETGFHIEIYRSFKREREKENDTFSPIILPKMVIYRRVATTINRNVSY